MALHRHMRGPRVLYRADGRTFAEYVVKDLLARRPKGRHSEQWAADPAAHVPLTPGDAWSARTGHPGARRAQGSRDDSAVHAPQSVGDRERNSAARGAVS